MAKRKSSKNNDQPELPLGGDTPPAASDKGQVTSGKSPKSEDSTAKPAAPAPSASVSPGENGGQTPGLQQQATVKRKKGVKIHDDPAPLASAYRNWFLDYASYVILDRAVPHIDDGLKPVQRRVLHTLWDMDDGRFHKVANVVGATMKLHPHGDASIGAALVSIAQRGWLIEPQGNFGNLLTGDDAAAPRYIVTEPGVGLRFIGSD